MLSHMAASRGKRRIMHIKWPFFSFSFLWEAEKSNFLVGWSLGADLILEFGIWAWNL